MTLNQPVAGSFRDPSGFLFVRDKTLYRQIGRVYQPHYDHLMGSGLYRRLVEEELLIPHEEVKVPAAEGEAAYKIIQPRPLSFVSYSYEWCFSELKAAALTTLRIMKTALGFGMILKDAATSNIQFQGTEPLLIDTLSFEIYREGVPWAGYRQFCGQFLAPLALMALKDVRLSRLTGVHPDGIPLDMASKLLPLRSRLRPGILLNIHLHAKGAGLLGRRMPKVKTGAVSRISLEGIIDNLEGTIRGLHWASKKTEWVDYYADTNYSPAALAEKRELVGQYIRDLAPESVWDLGANTGLFSRLASGRGIPTVSFDLDPGATEVSYLQGVKEHDHFLLPLWMDLANPSPAAGWEHNERNSLAERGPADLILALALIHHLAIGNNLPFKKIASFLAKLGGHLIIEFVPKEDSQVQRMLAVRDDIFPGYNQGQFEEDFKTVFRIDRVAKLTDSRRLIYLMSNRRSYTE